MLGSRKDCSDRWRWIGNPEDLPMQRSSTKDRPYQECCVDTAETEIHSLGALHTCHKSANNNISEAERIKFLSARAEPTRRSCICNPCASMSNCRIFIWNMLTCGLYQICMHLPCLLSTETPRDNSEVCKTMTSVPDKNGFYPDICIGGVKVDTSVIEEEEDEQGSFSPSKAQLYSPVYPSDISFSDLQNKHLIFEDLVEDVDLLITQKLLEVFSEFEINELAKCTSDSMFLKRSQEISQLISDIVEEHNMEKHEAECRLVREIIRISTRKSRKKVQIRQQEPQRDSGNDTWRSSKKSPFDSISGGSLKISEEGSDDIEARKLRNNSNLLDSSIYQSPAITDDTTLLSHSMQT